MDPTTTKLELDVDVKGGKISKKYFSFGPIPQKSTNQFTKDGLTSEKFFTLVPISKTRCQITTPCITLLFYQIER